jgi:hypothetical protein
MPDRTSKKKPCDINQLAAAKVYAAVSEEPETQDVPAADEAE